MVEDLISVLAVNIWENFLLFLPKVLMAIIILGVGIFVGKALGKLISKSLKHAGIDKFISQEDQIPVKISKLAGMITSWILYIVFFQQAADNLQVAAISLFVSNILGFVYGVIGASLTIIVGYSLAIYLKDKIISNKSMYSDLLGKMLFFLILYLSVALALPLIGVDATLINNLLVVTVAAVGLGFAIALGLGLKDVFREIGKKYIKTIQKKK